jgi:DNA mismatch repair ATPase MutL
MKIISNQSIVLFDNDNNENNNKNNNDNESNNKNNNDNNNKNNNDNKNNNEDDNENKNNNDSNENNNENNNDNKNNNEDDSNENNSYKKYKFYVTEGVGWMGSILVLIPYVITLNKTTDFILNTLGASGLFIVCATSKQYQSIVINAAWIIGGIYKYFS